MPIFLTIADADFETRFDALIAQKREASEDVDAAAAAIIADVQARGVDAVIDLTNRFDKLALTPETLAFSTDEVDAACASVDPADMAALELAAERIRAYHLRQRPQDHRWTDAAGVELGWP